MIALRKMRSDEFQGYVDIFIPDYAEEISSNYDLDIQTATKQAEQSVSEELKLGVETPDQLLLCIIGIADTSNTPLGYLWCQPNRKNQTIFISDFCILPSHRGKGLGRLALTALDEWFAKTEFTEIRLRVAADNKIAEKLYLSSGYAPTGINMRKAIP
ncbi:GNAT family N-acetyltransferase [Cohaesibacter gelatinilyticus]|uniref:Ribosomal protein S18 acetylase RimI n=1 Tax=Cohaesibacter gelatinilyticus TaxID=372072 RepID=A0A285PC12_9HYPH|nr:GNAT family N-acetyltransferase [Cohaesibacter gelatinilyticus]SNZ19300.1 Ribosomal protein S18 acetylase RimI [Cohaesibacter gelatinilyticus]HAT87236.1 N-acetyltransferase [Hyphomicrobiales bacterium]